MEIGITQKRLCLIRRLSLLKYINPFGILNVIFNKLYMEIYTEGIKKLTRLTIASRGD